MGTYKKLLVGWGLTYTESVDHFDKVFESFEVGRDDDGWVDVPLQEALDGSENLTCEDDD